MEASKHLTAIYAWRIKQYNEQLRQLFVRYNSIDDAILRLETTAESQQELAVFRLQKTNLRNHINRVLRS